VAVLDIRNVCYFTENAASRRVATSGAGLDDGFAVGRDGLELGPGTP
jgi:hypothetical protein